jgi:hypothetical protein
MAQFPMGRNTGRNFPVRGPGLDELLELLQNQGLTTQDENTKQRLESLRRADAGTSPLRARLYESLYKTGPVDIGEMTVDQERMPSSVDNSMRFGNTTYAEQGPPIIGGNVPTQRESASFGIPASVVNDMNRKPLLDPSLSRRTPAMQTERLQREADREVAADNYESQGPTMEQMEQGGLILEGERRREANPLQISGAIQRGIKSSIDPQIQQPSMDRVEEGEIAPVGEGVEVGLLERLGNTGIVRALRENPELAASGAQLLGGLISNAAQNRAQRRADRTTDQRVARANLISAITGGRARPTVERAQADTGGFLSLDTLGKAFQGGGAAYKSELARQVEEGERERKAKLEERGMKASELGAKSLDTYRKAMVDLNKKQLDADTKEAAAKLAFDYLKEVRESEKGRDLSEKKITEFSSTLATLEKLDNLEDFIMSSDLSFLEMGPLSLEEPSQFIFGSDSKVAKAKIQGLIGEVAQTIPGVLTEQDQKRLESRLVSLNSTKATATDIAESFREELTIRLQEDLSGFAASKFNVDYFQNKLDKYLEGRGAQGFESMLTKDEIVLGE